MHMDKEDLVNHYLKKLNSTDIIKYIFTLNIIKELRKYMNMKTTLLIALLYRYIKFYSLVFKSIFLYKSFICRKIFRQLYERDVRRLLQNINKRRLLVIDAKDSERDSSIYRSSSCLCC